MQQRETSVKGGTVTTDAAGGAGLFAYGDGTVYAKLPLKTTQDTSGGIHAAGGGKLYAWDERKRRIRSCQVTVAAEMVS